MNNQSYSILSQYLKETGVPFSKPRLKQLLSSHPDSNSLYAIVDVLDELSIENIALRLGIDDLQENGFPAIVHTNEDRGAFVLVTNISDDKIYYYKAEGEQTVEPLDMFIQKWSGVALYVVQDELPVGKNHNKDLREKNLKQWRAALAILVGLSCVALWSVYAVWSVSVVLLFILCAFGLTISILLTMHDFGESNRLLHKVCHLNRTTNCNAVLQSSAAKLFGWLSMSDIGLCYFSGKILSLVLAANSNNVVSWLLILAMCTFPYTVFSLWFQALKIKRWCLLCLGVIGILWAEIALTIFIWSSLPFFPILPDVIFSLLMGFAMPIFAWAYVKPLWKEHIRVRGYEYRYMRLKRMPEFIRAMLAREPAKDMKFSADDTHLGTIDAPVHITVLLSLNCRPCAKLWVVLVRLLAEYSGSLWLTVRFSTGKSIKDVFDTFSAIYLQQGEEAFCKALTD